MGGVIGRRSGFAGVALTAATLCIAPTTAAAAPVLEAECLGPPTNLLGPTTSNQRVAQTFGAQTSGSVIQGRVEIQKPAAGTGDWLMQIYGTDNSGNPVDPALATTSIPDAGVPPGDSTLIGNFPAPAIIQPGQQYALSVVRSVGFYLRYRAGDPCPGRVHASNTLTGPWFEPGGGPFDLVFMVLVQPAPETTPPQPQGDTNPPTATITAGPAAKTSKKQATFAFTGADTRAVASFECSLDGSGFAPCTSPRTVKAGRGTHNFSVRAVDDSGNVGQPATATWKVKKKKRKG